MTDNKNNKGVRQILLTGIFWRILFIEAVLLVFSLFFRWFTEDATPMELFWYGVRIIILVGIIILFMMVTLKKFLTHRIIAPLEAIAAANKKIQDDMSVAEDVEIPDNSPHEIRTIITSRTKMLKTIFDVSEERLRLVNFIRETFGRYLSSKVVDEILESPEGQKIGGRRKTVTVLMSDLRGFTSLSETREPGEMVQLLNRYLEQMSKIILKYDGIIDEIIGDAVLAVFGAPESHGDDPERAIACALEMQNCLGELNKEIIQSGYPPLEMGIGINTGTVIVGNIGSQLRMKYGIVGATVNTAARIESNSIGGQVLIGKSTFEQVNGKITAESPRNTMMKGLKKPLVFYSVSAIHSEYRVSLQLPVAANQNLSIKLPFQLWTIHDKKIDMIPRIGETIRLDDNTIDAVISPVLEPFTDIKLKFDFCIQAHCFEDIYAKNLSIEMDKDQKFNRLKITSMDQKDRNIIKKWMEQAAG
ncbi:MAG: adenylate/guanylate cyclase domain-containing protein [Proteobacteria bacterium]|nr:adenylate/guanylate cyclase domain-containing protein [Pseudomonadota bacterium]MBU1585864.1 adenylate/guanylate cyclase domain-containing protein [Pseudomonadota bacterium]MBU2627552.1 adenylate/guanylate cyclase domain-containing protein [Pseudomonadota bacterium]